MSSLINRSIWIGAGLLISSCSDQFKSSQFKLENLSTQIRYEQVNEQGLFLSQQLLPDPMMNRYKDDLESSAIIGSLSVQALGGSANTTSPNRIHIVFVGDGYASKDMAQYAADVEKNIQIFLNELPFKSYEKYFAFHKIDVISASNQISAQGPSGTSTQTSTALDMQYNCNGIERLLCVNLAKVTKAIQPIPKVDAVFALANSNKYGGAGYSNPPVSTLAARNPASAELALHEFGHSFVGLADEYDSSGISTNCASFANVSSLEKAQMLAQKSKWSHWLSLQNVGTFPGSCYDMKFFRPTLNSKMRSLGSEYEEVNTEQFIFKIYEKVRPIDSYSPNNNKTLRGNPTLQIQTLEPTETPLQITWTIQGQRIAPWDGLKTVQVQDLHLKKGSYKINVNVTDPTPRVRDEIKRSLLLSQNITWKIKVR